MKYNHLILLDIETQRDFFHPAGSCYSPQAAKVAANIYHLFRWVKQKHMPVISTLLRVRPGEWSELTGEPHCVEGTEGELKMGRTVLSGRINLGMLNTTDMPERIFSRYQQVIFEKRDTDIFAHVRAERLISELKSATFVICGAGISGGIMQAAIGLRNRGLGVIVAEDAVLGLNEPADDMAMLRMQAKGVIFASTRDIIAPKPKAVKKAFRTLQTAGNR